MNKISLIIGAILLTTNLQANEAVLMLSKGVITPVNNAKNSKGCFVMELIMSSLVRLARESRDFVDMESDTQLLDSALNIEESAFGIYVSNEYIVSPVVQNSPSEGEYIGLVLQHSF